MNQHRRPPGTPTGGQFASQAKTEADFSLSAGVAPESSDFADYRSAGYTTVTACEECGSAMIGAVNSGARGALTVPGATCRNCGHGLTGWEGSWVDEDGTWGDLLMDEDGTVTSNSADGPLCEYQMGDEGWGNAVSDGFFVDPENVERAIADRNGLGADESAPDD